MILCRPVTQRATLIAFSFASAPPLVKKDIFRLPGVTSATSRQRRARLGRHRRPDRGQFLRLLLDRGDDLRVPVADRHVHELRGEVEVALAVVVPEVAALGARDGNRVDRALHRPGVEDELLRVRLDLLPELGIGLDRGHGFEAYSAIAVPVSRSKKWSMRVSTATSIRSRLAGRRVAADARDERRPPARDLLLERRHGFLRLDRVTRTSSVATCGASTEKWRKISSPCPRAGRP